MESTLSIKINKFLEIKTRTMLWHGELVNYFNEQAPMQAPGNSLD